MKTNKNKAILFTLISLLLWGCDNANDLLNQHIKDGPIIYAAKIDALDTQSGYNRFRVNIFPAEDVNHSHCTIKWNIQQGVTDSAIVKYTNDNYDKELECYYSIIDISLESDIHGNLEISAQNTDTFGNKSLIETGSAYIYSSNYTASLINTTLSINSNASLVTFDNKIGMIGNIISYELQDGSFSQEELVTELTYYLTEAKRGGIIRTKTRYLINETDIDILEVSYFSENIIP